MDLLKHDIATEFPQFKDKIHTLKTTNQHFAKLYAEYDALNHKIALVETGGPGISDEGLEVMKKTRLRYKDDIVQMLHKA